MNVSVLEKPQTIKISSKRQITIPAKYYVQGDFGEYALCTWTDQGLLIQPLDVEGEDVSVSVLRDLVAAGYEGDELIAEYQESMRKIAFVNEKLAEAERDVAEGRVIPYDEMRDRIRAKYGF